MKYLKNIETGKVLDVVYFKRNNGEVLAEYADRLIATGNYVEHVKEEGHG